MSVYIPTGKDGKPKSPYYHYDFVIKADGQRVRVHGSTGERTKARAKEFEEQERRRQKDRRPADGMTLAAACLRYCDEVASGQPSAAQTETSLEHCCRLLGGHMLLVNISAEHIVTAVQKRSKETYGKQKPKRVSNATVNRQIVEPLLRILRRAKRVWGVSCDADTIPWTEIKLKEPKERIREFSADEAKAFWSRLRPDYHPFVWFMLNRGFRVNATINMQKNDVELDRMRVRIHQKKKGLTWEPISRDQAEVLRSAMEISSSPQVWTYVVQRPNRHARKGERRPITYGAFKVVMKSTLEAAGISDFRIHDMRHDFATKLLRATGNLALVKKALGHSDIATTMRYAHVLDDEVSAGMSAMPRNFPGDLAAEPAPLRPKSR